MSKNPKTFVKILCLMMSSATWTFNVTAPAHADDQQMSLTDGSGKRLTEIHGMSEPVPLSGAALSTLAQRVNSDLEANRPMAAAILLEQFSPAEIGVAADLNRYVELMEKTSQALFLRGKSFPDNPALLKSISISTQLLTLIDKGKEPGRLALAQINLGKALSVHGARFGDHPEMDKGIATLRTATKAWTVEDAPERWADAQLELAEAMIASARISETNEKFDEAIEVCQLVIDAQKSERLDLAATRARSVMSNALWQYGQRQSDVSMISQAASLAEVALDGLDKSTRSLEWARTLGFLANANREYAIWTGDRVLLADAIGQYHQSLAIRTRDEYPLEWAQTQLDFGNALLHYPAGTPVTADGAPSVQAYRKSLEIRTKENTPLEWAMSQNNLAVAISQQTPDYQPETLEGLALASKGFKAALTATTRDSAPLDWALMKDNLAQGLVRSYRSGQAARNKAFDREMDAAMRAQENYPLEKRFEMHELAMAKIVEKFGAADEMEEALRHYDDILTLYTKESHPWRWLRVSRRKAGVLETLAIQNRNPIRMREVISIFREHQSLLQRQYDPASWSQLEHRIARSLGTIGNMTNDPVKLREAETAYLQSMEAMPDKSSDKRNEINIELAGLRCQIGKSVKDDKIIALAVAQYEEVNKANRLAGLTGDAMSIDLAIKRCKGIPYVLSGAEAKRIQELRAQGK